MAVTRKIWRYPRATLERMTSGRSRFALRALATFIWFTLFAGQFWRNALSWYGFGIIVGIVLIAAVVVLMRTHPRQCWRTTPKSLLAFLLFCIVSISWSFYPLSSALASIVVLATTVGAAVIALCLPARDVVRSLADALRWILGLSLVFELIVAVFVRAPLLPFFVDYGGAKVPMAFYWSRALLLEGGPIEGIVASRNLLAFIALLGIIVFWTQWRERLAGRGWAMAWLVVASLTFGLTRSATVVLVAVAVGGAACFVVWARRAAATRRQPVYVAAVAAVAASGAALVTGWPWILTVLGKSTDVTGRFDIWAAVIDLASQRPWFGWGWVSYWTPWVEPFDNLAVRNGVTYLQAHNAWLDVWLQLGILGLVVFGALVVSTLWRSWFLAVDRPRVSLEQFPPFAPASALPLLLIVALIAQSFAESRILIEGGWMLLAVLAISTKRRSFVGSDSS